jgi:hypothetical protein
LRFGVFNDMVDGSIDDLDETHSRIGSLHRTQTTRCRQHPSPEAADRTAYRGRPARERPEPSSGLGAQVSDFAARESLVGPSRVRAFAIVLLLLGAMGINMLMTHNTSTGTVETTGQSGAVSPR